MPDHTQEQTIVFFDGYCGLCSKAVNFLLEIDSQHRLHFAPLQGSTASELLAAEVVQDLDTIVVWQRGVAHERSRAILNAMVEAGGVWRLMGVFKIVPSVLSVAVYRFIARNRYKCFGKSDTCRLPSAEERSYFLP